MGNAHNVNWCKQVIMVEHERRNEARCMVKWAIGLIAILSLSTGGTVAPSGVTFHKDVEPILQNRCQICHHTGDIGPMSFMNYKEARPWAKAIRAAILQRKMPPWFADNRTGHFSNDRSLPQAEIDTLVAWVDTGAVEGDPAEAPKPLDFTDGWHIGKPDLIVEVPNAFQVPANGAVPYQYIRIPSGFREDRWVTAVEVLPSNRAVVHHINASSHTPGTLQFKAGEFIALDVEAGNRALVRAGQEPPTFGVGDTPDGELLEVFVPGTVAKPLKPGQARLIKAGSDILLQLHFTTTGKPEQEKTRVGFVFAKEPPVQRVREMLIHNAHFTIPARESNARVEARAIVNSDAKLVSLLPHMHVRGKDFEYRAIYPSGEVETLLAVPHYDFRWQLKYYLEDEKPLPKGTIIECIAHYDNSPNNPANPDANVDVQYGEQTWEEMLDGFLEVTMDPNIPAPQIFGAAPSH